MRESCDLGVDILLVDDREDGLIALEALLQHQKNYRLVTARSGHEALAKLPLHDFAMILLDVQMPILDGFQTAELIRRQTKYQSIPIIFVTAINKDDRYVYRGFEVGAVDYIFKPFDPLILRSKVAVFADLHLMNRRVREQAMLLAERESLAQRARLQALEIESLRRYRNLADAIPHIVLRATGPDVLEYHNVQWSDYTGLTGSASFGAGWQSAIDPRDLPSLVLRWQKAIQNSSPFESEARLRAGDGNYHWHWVRAVPERGADEQLKNWLVTMTNIDEIKNAEQNLKEARQMAEEANNAKTHFLANMSHEIRTPLNAIMGFSDILLDTSIPASEKRDSARIIRRNGNQLLRIIDEILDFSKVEAGGLEIECVDTSMTELLEEIKILMNAQLGKKNLDLSFEIEPGFPARAVTDSTRLRQILLNVIGNAIKFTDKGSVEVVAREVERNGERFMQFEVRDTGLGIDSVSAEKIFEAFSQADSSTTRLYGGTGLGLALSRRLARALGGDVRLLHSEPGKGSRFLIEVKYSAEIPVTSVQNRSAEVVESIAPHQAEELEGKSVLLVEDSDDNQTLIVKFLTRLGLRVDVASNGRDGVEKALDGDYQAVLMDIQMPQMDGYQATARLRQAGYKKPIIALTAYAREEERERSLLQGCDEHLTKPVDRGRLIETLKRAVRQ